LDKTAIKRSEDKLRGPENHREKFRKLRLDEAERIPF